MSSVEVLVLGPVVVRRGRDTVVPSGPLVRGIIGVLALAGEAGLSDGAFVAAAWPGRSDIGGSAAAVGVHRARRWLAEHVGESVRIERTTTGYRLSGADVDARRFRSIRDDAAALALWRGSPLADTPFGDVVAPLVEALERARLDMAIRHARSLPHAGGAAAAVDVVAPLAEAHPLDEPLHAVLIEALASSGRQADALSRYERLRLRWPTSWASIPAVTCPTRRCASCGRTCPTATRRRCGGGLRSCSPTSVSSPGAASNWRGELYDRVGVPRGA
ncbi:MAG TPA: bacterial transcriptional activator domain-containing protein [Pseudonocardiaceae bacterium]|nr:bacterial transcriptional activator domain-containing protein [Pseudonocardiaceae bacterium]